MASWQEVVIQLLLWKIRFRCCGVTNHCLCGHVLPQHGVNGVLIA